MIVVLGSACVLLLARVIYLERAIRDVRRDVLGFIADANRRMGSAPQMIDHWKGWVN